MSRTSRRRARARFLGTLLVVVGLAAGLALYLDLRLERPDTGAVEPVSEPSPAAAPEVATAPRVDPATPTEPEEVAEPLPDLEASDAPLRLELADIVGSQAVERFLAPDGLVERFVATVDSLPERKLPLKIWPLQPTPGTPLTRGEGGARRPIVLAEDNPARYAPLISVLQAAPADALERLYRRYSPLLQHAYEDLGTVGSFNDRLIEVIDHLLETPEIQGPIELVRPRVYYQYADPALEDRSAGQKLLIRMGVRNAAVVKAKLREMRQRLTRPEDAPQ